MIHTYAYELLYEREGQVRKATLTIHAPEAFEDETSESCRREAIETLMETAERKLGITFHSLTKVESMPVELDRRRYGIEETPAQAPALALVPASAQAA